ncbi:TetR/AcrR family transcriptional regulator [Microbacterium sp. 2P01SA-2]|uniref:TetR/AcrR family transcriptional regulator n=1 Tax=unclassified Microbacterium TaxID=2609290 RepID=UPI00399F260F
MSGKKVGRPRAQDITDDLLREGERVIAEDGFSALTIDGLVSRAGSTRPTFYRRFRSAGHFAVAVLAHRFAPGPAPATGSLPGDLRAVQREEIAVLADPVARNSLADLVGASRTDHDLSELLDADFIRPRRERVRHVIDAARARGEIEPPDADADQVYDLLMGPLITRMFVPPHAAPDDRLAEAGVRSALTRLGFDIDDRA